MLKKRIYQCLGAAGLALAVGACKTPELVVKNESRNVPASYSTATPAAVLDSANSARVQWKQFFTDPNLQALIGTALQNNQELNITLQEIEIARNEIRARQGEYLPFVRLGGRADVEKVGRYTLQGATEEQVNIKEDRRTPDPLTNFQVGAFATWEVDIWHKLRNARKAAAIRYLATVEGKNFMVTNLIAEIATSYYELLALDNQLLIVQQNIGIQSNALELVKLQKESARTTELAVKRFEAQVQHTRALQFKLQQQIVETENKLNYLAGRYPQPVARDAQSFNSLLPLVTQAGSPTQLLANRPDIRQAEQQLIAANANIGAARAAFFPRISLTANAGSASTELSGLFKSGSFGWSLAPTLLQPLFDAGRNKANLQIAQVNRDVAVAQYERAIQQAFREVADALAGRDTLAEQRRAQQAQVAAEQDRVRLADLRYRNGASSTLEVLDAQRSLFTAQQALVQVQALVVQNQVTLYRVLGGGWTSDSAAATTGGAAAPLR